MNSTTSKMKKGNHIQFLNMDSKLFQEEKNTDAFLPFNREFSQSDDKKMKNSQKKKI